jgi:hypothetical protein
VAAIMRESTGSEEFARRQLALQPLFNGALHLLGQVAGLLLLANAGSDPDRQQSHLIVAHAQWQELQERCASAAPKGSAAGRATGESIDRLGILLQRLERRFAASLRDDGELRAMLEELAGIRRLLHNASCPHHGLAVVDLTGACCAASQRDRRHMGHG